MRQATWARVCARRMRRHGLVDPLPTLAEVTARTCGMHAQVMSAAEVALGVRTSGVTRQGVR
ncbi:MAG: winged helix DNA-binding domain-containing protein, partial [Kineosporiaceae bacterium]